MIEGVVLVAPNKKFIFELALRVSTRCVGRQSPQYGGFGIPCVHRNTEYAVRAGAVRNSGVGCAGAPTVGVACSKPCAVTTRFASSALATACDCRDGRGGVCIVTVAPASWHC
jgi:hypothetical protein